MDSLAYIADGFWREKADPRIDRNYPIMSGGPLPILAIVGLYLYFVRVIGPRWMKSRDPFELTWTIRVYNIAMSLSNLYMFYKIGGLTKFGINYFGCVEVGNSRQDNEMIPIAFMYFSTKIIELLDTVFFVMRKKYNQASNLHVFHHSFIAVCSWSYFKLAPGGSSVLFPFLNMGVHSVMYFYYFLATYPGTRKYLWWKHHLTSVQMFQFVLSMIHFSFQGLSTCSYPPQLAAIGFFFNFVFLVLFADFYYGAYIKAPRKAAAAVRQRKQEQNEHSNLPDSPKGPRSANGASLTLRARQSTVATAEAY